MVHSVLVLCVGNICRSPAGERMLRAALPGLEVGSAGLGAVVGAPADSTMAEAAAERGLSLEGHVARQFDAELGAGYELILAMEPIHRDDVRRLYPQLSGRTLLFDPVARRARHRRSLPRADRGAPPGAGTDRRRR